MSSQPPEPHELSGQSMPASDCTEIATGVELEVEPESLADKRSSSPLPPTTNPELLAAGDCVDRYEFHSKLGSGSFGVVWKCYDTQLERFVAIKVSKSRSDTATPSGNLLDEARRVAKLTHDGIVRVYDVLQIGSEYGIVSELIVGETLKERLETGNMPERELLAVIQQVAAGLQHAHQADIIHRDVKPGNILIRQAGTAAITDFGLATTEKQLESIKDRSSGTIYFMSPEQARGDVQKLDNRSDIFCLGLVLFYGLTGRLPYPPTSSPAKHAFNVATRHAKSLRTIDRYQPKSLELICKRCLALDPSERYGTAQDLVEELESYLKSTHQSNATSTNSARRTLESRAWPLVTVTALIACGIVLIPWHSPPATTLSNSENAAALGQSNPTVANATTVSLPPTIFAWPDADDRGTPEYSGGSDTWSVATPTSRFIGICGETNGAHIHLMTELAIDQWSGCAGLFWGLRQDPDNSQSSQFLCYAAEFQHFPDGNGASICVSELTLAPRNSQEMDIRSTMEISVTAVPIPDTPWSTLEIHTRNETLEILFNGKTFEVAADLRKPWMTWSPEVHKGEHLSCGVTGYGKKIAFRRLMEDRRSLEEKEHSL